MQELPANNKLKKNHKAAVRDPYTQLSIGRRPLCAHTLRGSKRTSCCPPLIGKGFSRGTSFPLNDLLFPFLSSRKGKARGLGGGLSTPKSRGRNLLPTNKPKKNCKATVRDPRTQLSIGRRPLYAHALRGAKEHPAALPLLERDFQGEPPSP